jgi:hypothetical protein
MTLTFFGLESASSGHLNPEEIEEANKQTLKSAGPLKIAGSKLAHYVRPRDFVMIDERPCQVESTRFVSPTEKLLITGRPTVPAPEHLPKNRYRFSNPCFAMEVDAMEVDAMDEVQCPEVNFLFVSQFRKGEYLAINDRPCKILDFSTSKCGCCGGAKSMLLEWMSLQGGRRKLWSAITS